MLATSAPLEKGHTTVSDLIEAEELGTPSDQTKQVVMLEDKFENRREKSGEASLYPPTDGITCYSIICYTDDSKRDGLRIFKT